MLTIDKMNNITLTQGNSAEIGIIPKYTDGEPVIPVEGDKCIFTVKYFNKTLIEKTLTINDYDEESGEIVLTLHPNDTKNIPPGNYIYDSLYVFADDSAYTFISKAIFRVAEAISKAGDDDE